MIDPRLTDEEAERAVIEAAMEVTDKGKRSCFEFSESVTVQCDTVINPEGSNPLCRMYKAVRILRAERAPKPRYKIMEGACYFVPDSRNFRDVIIVDEVGVIVAKAPTEERAQQLLELLNAAEAKK